MQRDEIVACAVLEAFSENAKIEQVKKNMLEQFPYYSFYTKLQDWNIENRNGRTYFAEAMIPALGASYIQELINAGKWCGEWGHPITQDVARILTIDPDRVSHRITSLDVDQRQCSGWIDTLIYGKGPEFTKAILQGDKPSFSLRALAKIIKKNGKQFIRQKARVVAYDAVILPSNMSSYIDETKGVKFKTASFEDKYTPTSSGIMIPNKPGIVTESVLVPCMESFLDYLSEESVNIKSISNQYEVTTENMTLTEDKSHVILREDSNLSYIVKLEDKAKNDVRDFMARW